MNGIKKKKRESTMLKVVGEMWLENPYAIDYVMAEIEGDVIFSGDENGNVATECSDEQYLEMVGRLKTDIARHFLGEDLVPSGISPPKMQPWSGHVRGYNPRKLYYIIQPGTSRVLGRIGRETDLSGLCRGLVYPVVAAEEEKVAA